MKDRKSNIELLRILTMLGVIILHINNPQIGGGIAFANSINKIFIYFFESIFIVAVNLFILISGYFLIDTNKRNIWKVLELLIQVITYNIAIYFLKIGTGEVEFNVRKFIFCFFITNYYVVLYSTLYFISPYLNILIKSVKNKDVMILGILIIFSVIPTLIDFISEVSGINLNSSSTIGMYGSEYGYTIINFIIMYLLGAYIRIKGFENIKLRKLFLYLIFCVIILTIWAKFNDYTGFMIERSAWEYCNPIVIIECCLIFIIFNNMKIINISIINNLAEATFSVFLLHTLFFKYFNFEIIFNKNILLMSIIILCVSLLIYIICYILDIIYRKTVYLIISKIKNKYKLKFEVELINEKI